MGCEHEGCQRESNRLVGKLELCDEHAAEHSDILDYDEEVARWERVEDARLDAEEEAERAEDARVDAAIDEWEVE